MTNLTRTLFGICAAILPALAVSETASAENSSPPFFCHVWAEICGPTELAVSEVDGPYDYVYQESFGAEASNYTNLVDDMVQGSGCGNGDYGCEIMRISQATETAAFRFDFLEGPQTIFGFVIWNDRGTTGDGVAELEVILYDSSDNIVAAFETPMEDKTTEHSIYFGDPDLPAGSPGALQGFADVAYAVWRIRSFHGDPGPDPNAHQLREVGFNPVTDAGYEVIATQFDPTAGSIPDDTSWYEVCTHPCPSKIRMRRSQRDFFYLRLGMDLPGGFDPATSEFKVRLLSDGNSVFEGTLNAGDVTKRGHKWNFRDRGARTDTPSHDGIAFMSMSPNREGIWRWQLKGFADLSAATDPTITVVVEIDGTVSFARTESWQDRSNGFVFDLTNP